MTASVDRGALARLLVNEADMAAARRVKTVLEFLEPGVGDRVLDAGCGLGWFLEVIGEVTPALPLGCDLDVGRLRSARRAVRRPARVASAHLGRLPFADAVFDRIVLSEVLEHVEDDLGALVEVTRVTRPGGVVAVTVPHRRYPFLWDPVNRFRELLGVQPIRTGFFGGIWTHHLRLYDRDALTGLIGRAGLVVEDLRPLVHACVPFAHNLVYGLGMTLVERGILPRADRFAYAENRGRPWAPLNLARALLRAVDRRNDRAIGAGESSVILAVKARRPMR